MFTIGEIEQSNRLVFFLALTDDVGAMNGETWSALPQKFGPLMMVHAHVRRSCLWVCVQIFGRDRDFIDRFNPAPDVLKHVAEAEGRLQISSQSISFHKLHNDGHQIGFAERFLYRPSDAPCCTPFT